MAMIPFNIRYFVLTIILVVTEVLIAAYTHDDFIRPYVGDYLVVLLLFCFVKSVVNLPVRKAVFAVLVFSYLVESLQYFHFVERIGLGNVQWARIVIGTNFAWQDIIAYTLGAVTIVLFAGLRKRRKNRPFRSLKTELKQPYFI